MSAALRITFEGAARTVTGSRHLVHWGARSFLFDCGLYQGHRDEAERINRTFRFDPAGLEAVVVSHAHLDHTGNLPTLVAAGFPGPIYSTPATLDLTRVLLPDSAYLMERDVEHVNRHLHGGRPQRRPLYTVHDVESTLERFRDPGYGQKWNLFDDVEVQAWDAGHILGSALTVFEFRRGAERFRLGMSGDLGRPDRPILRDPQVHPGVDALVLESTYGDRLHPDGTETERQLAEVVNRTVERGGRVLVPAFAVGRTQELVATLHALTERNVIPELPIYVDSPMARKATEVFRHHPECFDEETRRMFDENHGEPFGFHRLRYLATAEESRSLNEAKGPMIVISASGMCEGGRILHHLRHGLGDARNTVLFVGYQGDGTLGRRLREGAETVNILGEPVRRRAEVAGLDGFSAHADQRELVQWVERLVPRPRRICLVHGEPRPADTLADLLRRRVGCEVTVPSLHEEVELWV
jgi:metallo-beta-lactamase family protein